MGLLLLPWIFVVGQVHCGGGRLAIVVVDVAVEF